ncbi:hypothetical protein B398_06520 [Xylella fastidiosa 32]|nr:hypothetical protein B398_06520 [Xylella fastidiosa 32]
MVDLLKKKALHPNGWKAYGGKSPVGCDQP